MTNSGAEQVRLKDASRSESGGRPNLEIVGSPTQSNVNSPRLITTLADDLPQHKTKLEQYRGKKFLGLPQNTLPTLDKAISGFRGLMLLAAPPNMGKTALGVQIGLDIVKTNPDACFFFVSMEMSRWDIMTRMLCRLAQVNYDTLARGNPPHHNLQDDVQLKVNKAEEHLRNWGQRIHILDDPEPSLDLIQTKLAALKRHTGASTAFILIDYLQIWSIPNEVKGRIHSDLDADKYRIGAMKQLQSTGDAVLVISEVRKAGTGDKPSDQSPSAALADVMGSARAGYTPDMVFILRPKDNQTASQSPSKGHRRYDQEEDTSSTLPVFQRLELHIVKGRDGVTKRTIPLNFYYNLHQFEETNGR